MPLYEFKCSKCRLIFEQSASMKQAPSELNCPSCNSVSVRHYASMNFSFKGGKPTTFDIDYIVGREAEKGWKAMESRLDDKNKLRKQSNENFIVKAGDDFKPSTVVDKQLNREIHNSKINFLENVDAKALHKQVIKKEVV